MLDRRQLLPYIGSNFSVWVREIMTESKYALLKDRANYIGKKFRRAQIVKVGLSQRLGQRTHSWHFWTWAWLALTNKQKTSVTQRFHWRLITWKLSIEWKWPCMSICCCKSLTSDYCSYKISVSVSYLYLLSHIYEMRTISA